MELVNKFNKLETEMNKKYINRTDEVRGLLVSLLARGNMVLLGEAGTGKTDMVQTLARAIDTECFETLATRTSSLEEFFGALDIRELEQGRYVRNLEHTLATAGVAFVDEMFKGNSATLNGLLGVMAQRVYKNENSIPTPIPLQLFVGASNEMPEGGEGGILSALWDRCELRYVVDHIKDEGSFIRLLKMTDDLEPKTKITMKEVLKCQEQVYKMDIDEGAYTLMVNLWKELKDGGYIISERKWRNSLHYLKANAFLDGRDKVEQDDLCLYNHILWATPEQIRPIRKIVNKFIRSEVADTIEQYDVACELMAELDKFGNDDNKNKEKFKMTKAMKAATVHTQISRIKHMMETNQRKLVSSGKKKDPRVEKCLADTRAMLAKITDTLLGGD